ncbi:MAG: peptidoglycan editing factor PgeF [Ignavibacteriaceae bacterium]
MIIIKSQIFNTSPEIIFGFSTKVGAGRNNPFYFNMSHSVGDDKNIVEENRALFFQALGLKRENIALQKQVHGEEITYVKGGGIYDDSDAMITDKKNIGLAVSTADCAAIFLYDTKHKVIAGIHSGWRGTEKKILLKTLHKLKDDFNTSAPELIAYIAPAISQMNYEIGKEVAVLFDNKYLLENGAKFLLDVSQINYDILVNFGLPKNNIQISKLCSFRSENLLHSYRREGLHSGRALGVIAMK